MARQLSTFNYNRLTCPIRINPGVSCTVIDWVHRLCFCRLWIGLAFGLDLLLSLQLGMLIDKKLTSDHFSPT